MVAVRITRQSSEVGASAGSPAGATRVDVEAIGSATDPSGEKVRITRQSVEVGAVNPQPRSITRVDVEAAGSATAPSSGAVQITRQSVEVGSSISPRAGVLRADVEAVGSATAPSAGAVQVTRQSGEVVGRRGASGVVVPLALNDDAELFLHDWADQVTLRSAYLTDVSISPISASEARRSLKIKPERSMDVVWRQSSTEFDENDLSRLDRLYVFLRRLTGARYAVPLYPDQRVLSAAYLTTDSTIFLDTTRGRWFQGARIAIVRLNISGSYKGHSFHTILSKQDDRLTLSATLGVAVPAGSIVVPTIDCETALEVSWKAEQGCLAEVTLTVDEVPGASALPPTRTDVPRGAQTHRDVPILDVTPDWSSGVGAGRSRPGQEFRSGRARAVATFGDRSRATSDERFTNERPSYWKLVEFFDTRRGRGRTFWHVDHEYLWTVVALDPSFISVSEFGDFADFQEELQNAQVGLEMSDGTFYVRDVLTVEHVSTVYKINVDPTLPSGLSPASVLRVARARRVRFVDDVMTEVWTHAGLAETEFKMIEALNEEDAETS